MSCQGVKYLEAGVELEQQALQLLHARVVRRHDLPGVSLYV